SSAVTVCIDFWFRCLKTAHSVKARLASSGAGNAEVPSNQLGYKNLLSGYSFELNGSRLARQNAFRLGFTGFGGTPCDMARRLRILATLWAAFAPAALAAGPSDGSASKLDRELEQRAQAPRGHSRVIVRLTPGADADRAIHGVRGTVGRRLESVSGQVADVPDAALDALSRLPPLTPTTPPPPPQPTPPPTPP